MIRSIAVRACALSLAVPMAAPLAAQPLSVTHVARLTHHNAPSLLYWFVNAATLDPAQYRKDIDEIARNGSFTTVFLTARNGVDFYDYAKMKPIFADLVAYARSKGIAVGLQLWNRNKPLASGSEQAIVVDGETDLDANGRAQYVGASQGVRMAGLPKNAPPGTQPHLLYKGLRSKLLRVYAFRRADDGHYIAGSLIDITSKAVATQVDPLTVSVAIDAGAGHAGWHAFVMTAHYHDFPDLYGPFVDDGFKSAIAAYRDVGFVGGALDEFRYMSIGLPKGAPFRQRLYSDAMAATFTRSGIDLPRMLLDMRYAPVGQDGLRVAAINRYFASLRQTVLRIETDAAAAAKATYGPNAFIGIHDTFHNGLEGDEAWQTGINWWAVPRDYGQTDESTPIPTQLGIAQGTANAVSYNQYYSRDETRFLEHVAEEARWNIRTHYHAWNDVQNWGIDIRTPSFLAKLTALEDKLRLIDAFAPGRPRTDTLMLFGMPALTNRLASPAGPNQWDINGTLNVEEKAVALWREGFRLVVAPSYQIDAGKIAADDRGGMVYNGKRYTSVIFIGPEFSTGATLTALERFTARGGKLALDGTATRDVDGTPIAARFAAIRAGAKATGADVAAATTIGAVPDAVPDGARYEDGSVVLTDLDSALDGPAKPFDLTLAGHHFAGRYRGALAIKVDAAGNLAKFAAGGIDAVTRDGRTVLALNHPADVTLDMEQRRITIVGDATLTTAPE